MYPRAVGSYSHPWTSAADARDHSYAAWNAYQPWRSGRAPGHLDYYSSCNLAYPLPGSKLRYPRPDAQTKKRRHSQSGMEGQSKRPVENERGRFYDYGGLPRPERVGHCRRRADEPAAFSQPSTSSHHESKSVARGSPTYRESDSDSDIDVTTSQSPPVDPPWFQHSWGHEILRPTPRVCTYKQENTPGTIGGAPQPPEVSSRADTPHPMTPPNPAPSTPFISIPTLDDSPTPDSSIAPSEQNLPQSPHSTSRDFHTDCYHSERAPRRRRTVVHAHSTDETSGNVDVVAIDDESYVSPLSPSEASSSGVITDYLRDDQSWTDLDGASMENHTGGTRSFGAPSIMSDSDSDIEVVHVEVKK